MFTYVIGDIHGCLESLKNLLNKIEEDSDNKLFKAIFIGDYIDRGPDSAGVIDYLINFQRYWPKTIFLMGNHEDMFLNSLENGLIGMENENTWLSNGGFQTKTSYNNEPIPNSHIEWMKRLHKYHETENNVFVHAAIDTTLPMNQQRDSTLLWTRYGKGESVPNFNKVLIHGHTPGKEIEMATNRYNIDTGAVFGGKLTAVKIGPKSGHPVDFLEVEGYKK
jgi:serine/threonine protein phosphatase 1